MVYVVLCLGCGGSPSSTSASASPESTPERTPRAAPTPDKSSVKIQLTKAPQAPVEISLSGPRNLTRTLKKGEPLLQTFDLEHGEWELLVRSEGCRNFKVPIAVPEIELVSIALTSIPEYWKKKEAAQKRQLDQAKSLKAKQAREAEQKRKREAAGFQKLSVDSVTARGGKVGIIGSTDLPDGALVNVTFTLPNRRPDDLYIGSDTKATVTNGAFEALLDFPQLPEFKQGPYLVELMFTPMGQNDSVTDAVGTAGERLAKGKSDGTPFKTWEISREIAALAAPKLPTFAKMPAAGDFPEASAEKCFVQMANAWSNEDWDGMAALTTDDWRAQHDDAADWLRDSFAIVPFGLVDIKSEPRGDSNMTFVTGTFHSKKADGIRRTQIKINMIFENGRWGWNPDSAGRRVDL